MFRKFDMETISFSTAVIVKVIFAHLAWPSAHFSAPNPPRTSPLSRLARFSFFSSMSSLVCRILSRF